MKRLLLIVASVFAVFPTVAAGTMIDNTRLSMRRA